MKTHFRISFLFFFSTFIAVSQINTSTGGAASLLPNSPTSNTNVGIGTNTPTQKLEVVGGIKGTKAIFPGGELSNQTYANWDAGIDASIFLSGGKTNPLFPNRRLFNVYDMSMISPYNIKLVGLNLSDRTGKERFTVNVLESSYTELVLNDAQQANFFKIKDYGDANGCYFHMPKPNTKFIIGGFADDLIIGDRKFVVKGNTLTQGKVAIGGDVTTPFGSFPTMSGTVNVSGYMLYVKGGILAHQVRVSTTWADYVFKNDYNLKPLSEVEAYIKSNGHLPNIPSAAIVEQDGIEVGQMAKMQQEKIEELTLYIIAQNKEIEKLKTQVKEIDALKTMVTELINKK